MGFVSSFGNTFTSAFSKLSGLIFLLRDEFTTPQSAPIPSPRACEPTGSIVITDTGNRISLSSGNMVMLSGSYGNPGIWSSSAYSRVSGLTTYAKVTCDPTGNGAIFGFDDTQSGILNSNSAYFNGTSFRIFESTDTVVFTGALNYSTEYSVLCILRSSGAFYLIKGGAYSEYTLMWVSVTRNDPSVFLGASTQAATSRFNSFRGFYMSSGWNSDYGICTNYIPSPIVNETTTSQADAIIEQTWTAVTGQTWDLFVRRTDDNNSWIIRSSQAGSTIKIIEKVAGVETERSSVAQTFVNGVSYRITVILNSLIVSTYVNNTPKNTYNNALFNLSSTGVKTDKSGTNLATYPRVLSGNPLTEIYKWTS